jgi:hypothetical protein
VYLGGQHSGRLQGACAADWDLIAGLHQRQRLEDNGVKFQKKLTDGRMKHIAFALDPDK